ncbi:hypothetical protein AVEN_127643-1, partial [Araneus ventricosus]
ENTALDEVLPARSDPPRLIAIGDVSKSISLFAYVDGTAVFSEKVSNEIGSFAVGYLLGV